MNTQQVDALARELAVVRWRGVHSADRVTDGHMQAGDVCLVNCYTA